MTYVYDQDTKGALSSVSIAIGGAAYSTAYTHDGFGRISSSTQTTAGQPYVFNYQYSLSDRLKQIQYPSGRSVNYVPDTAGRISAVQNGATLANYATLTYTAPGGVSTMALGNGITEQFSWNDRLQLTGLTVGSALTLNFYPCPGLLTACSTGNNGNLRAQGIVAPGLNVTQTYTYDNVDRLTEATETGTGTWKEGYKYDNTQSQTFGNRWVDPSPTARSGLPALTLETPQAPGWFLPNNQISGWTNDSAGNIQAVGQMSRSFTYDAVHRQLTATIYGTGSSYTYDGEGQRVRKSANGVTTTYVYDAWGRLAAEYGGGVTSPAAVQYVTVDHLGSTRMVTDSSGTVSRRYDYLPFGTELLAGTGGRTTAMGYQAAPDDFNPKFTGQMRDLETGLDYFHARYYSAAQGRFTGVDPENAGASLADPQTLNGYAYVNNNPLNLTDPSGEGIFGTIGGFIGGFLSKSPWGALAGFLIGNGIDAAIWGPGAAGIPGVSFNSRDLTACGGPLGNCGGDLGAGPWSERSPVGASVGGAGGLIIRNYNPGVHRDMTRAAAIAAGLKNLADYFANGVVGVDDRTQGTSPAMTHIHAMGGDTGHGVETCAQAYAGTKSGLQADIQAAQQGNDAAKFRALHRIQDSYSAAHQYKPWGGPMSYTRKHYVADGTWSEAPVVASTAFLKALNGNTPMGRAEDYLFRPSNCR